MKFSEFVGSDEPAFEVSRKVYDIIVDEDRSHEHLERVSTEARLVYHLVTFDGEIHNGGFNLVFESSLGNYCDELLSGLNKVGARNSARLLKSAMSHFPGSKVPSDYNARLEAWLPIVESGDVEEALFQLDDEFYADKDKLIGLLDDYVRSNKGATLSRQGTILIH